VNDFIRLIGSAKSSLDNGLSRVGRSLNPQDPVERVLILLASRAAAIANAVILLANHNHANEGTPLLRSLLEISSQMRWISRDESKKRAEKFIKNQKQADWEILWSTKRLNERMKLFGYSEELRESAAGLCYDHMNANAAGLPWGHVFKENDHKGLSTSKILSQTAEAMGHVLKALDEKWGEFPGSESIWKSAAVKSSKEK